jgi:hypothetical protein
MNITYCIDDIVMAPIWRIKRAFRSSSDFENMITRVKSSCGLFFSLALYLLG